MASCLKEGKQIVFVWGKCLLVPVHKYVSPETIFSGCGYFSSFVDDIVSQTSHICDWGGQRVVPIPDARVLS
jgi:hypothetical protein